jgi:hypothetical protein
VTDPAEFERRTQVRLNLARRKVRGMYQEAGARTQRLLLHPLGPGDADVWAFG